MGVVVISDLRCHIVVVLHCGSRCLVLRCGTATLWYRHRVPDIRYLVEMKQLCCT